MMSRPLCATCTLLLWIAVAAGPAALQMAAQDKKANSPPLDIELSRLQICLPNDPNLQILITGLMGGYSGGSYGRGSRGSGPISVSPPPPEYMASLDRDFDACSRAFHMKKSPEKQELLASIHKDIEIKSKDCIAFGMGRMIPVRISTVHGAATASGWAAFYKWSSVSSFPVAELRVPGLTSPAVLNLPPGIYTFRAELKVSDAEVKKTDAVIVPVGGQKMIDVQLPVP